MTYQGLRPILARGYCPQDDQRNVELVRLPFASKQAGVVQAPLLFNGER